VAKKWEPMLYVHALLGHVGTFFCVFSSIKMIQFLGWTVTDNVHSYMGLIAASLCLITDMLGSATMYLMKFANKDKPWTEKDKARAVGKVHRIFGYIICFVGNLTCLTGLFHYYKDITMETHKYPLLLLTLPLYTMLVSILEVRRRY
jgi:hypothetical protein